jgi:hypothetical protein
MKGIYSNINRILRDCKLEFKDNLQCILRIGSTLNKNVKPNDIDLIIILKTRESKQDILLLRKIIKNVQFPLDIQIINMVDIKGWNFSHFTHGQFFLYFLKSAQVMYGFNPLNNIFIDDKYLISSVFQKIQYYYFRAKLFLIENRYGNKIISKKDFCYHRKKILLMLADYWFITNNYITDIKDEDYEIILNNLCLNNLYLDNIEFFQKKKCYYTFIAIFEIYQELYFAINDSLIQESLKKGII